MFGGSSESEDDVELEVDFDRTIKIETEVGTLSEKAKFAHSAKNHDPYAISM